MKDVKTPAASPAAPTQEQKPAGQEGALQSRVHEWMLECFGAEIAADKVERADRFIEEALELTQAIGYSAERAHALVDYVFGRDIGEPSQEVGGVMITLAALCNTFGLDIGRAAATELARITRPEIVLKIRAKQAAKPTGSALPIALQSTAGQEGGTEVSDADIRRATLTMMDADLASKDPSDFFTKMDQERRDRLAANPDDPEWLAGYRLTRMFLATLNTQETGR